MNRRAKTSTVRAILAVVFVAWVAPAAGQSTSGRDLIDRVAAVVGDRVILLSEVANQVQLVFLQAGRRPASESEVDSVKEMVMEQMINDHLFLIAAKEDTTIEVREDEIDQALDDHIARVAENFESNDDFLAALSEEGLTLREFRRRYRDEVENQLLKQRLVQKKVWEVSVSRHEVEEFYRQFKDSIPKQPEALKLAQILLDFHASAEVEDSVSRLAGELRQRVLDGADFAALSAQHSGMGAGAQGGDLGLVRREELIPELARAAFNLEIGGISGVIRSPMGFHVVKCEGATGDRRRLRHIFLPVVAMPKDTAATYALGDSLLEVARGGADFRELAKNFSDDDNSRAEGGDLGWFAFVDLPEDFADALAGWNTPNEYRGPIRSRRGLHIFKLLDHQPEKDLILKNDFDQLKEMARQDKTGRIVDEWIAGIREKTYIDYRLEEDED